MDPSIRRNVKQLRGSSEEQQLYDQYSSDVDEYIYMALSSHKLTGYSCAKCKKQGCTVELLQTRSADEGMSAFLVCPHCSFKRLFS